MCLSSSLNLPMHFFFISHYFMRDNASWKYKDVENGIDGIPVRCFLTAVILKLPDHRFPSLLLDRVCHFHRRLWQQLSHVFAIVQLLDPTSTRMPFSGLQNDSFLILRFHCTLFWHQIRIHWTVKCTMTRRRTACHDNSNCLLPFPILSKSLWVWAFWYWPFTLFFRDHSIWDDAPIPDTIRHKQVSERVYQRSIDRWPGCGVHERRCGFAERRTVSNKEQSQIDVETGVPGKSSTPVSCRWFANSFHSDTCMVHGFGVTDRFLGGICTIHR